MKIKKIICNGKEYLFNLENAEIKYYTKKEIEKSEKHRIYMKEYRKKKKLQKLT